MTLSVHVFRIGDDNEMTLLDDQAMGSELAGFESFRTSVWGPTPSVAWAPASFPPWRAAISGSVRRTSWSS